MKRTDRASRVIAAPPQSLYRAFLEPSALVSWLPPKGMGAHFEFFDPRVGGGYRLVLTWDDEHAAHGKTSAREDVVAARFAELVPEQRVVQLVDFESQAPAFSQLSQGILSGGAGN